MVGQNLTAKVSIAVSAPTEVSPSCAELVMNQVLSLDSIPFTCRRNETDASRLKMCVLGGSLNCFNGPLWHHVRAAP